MIEIKPNALYTRADLTQLLNEAGVDVDTFISRLQARKVFKKLWLGSDLLEALRNAPELGDSARKPRSEDGRSATSGSRQRHSDPSMASLDALLEKQS